jgi:hypothetical protein
MRQLGTSLYKTTHRLLSVSNDLLAVVHSINSRASPQELDITHIDGGNLLRMDHGDDLPFHVGTVSMAAEYLSSGGPDHFQVTRHEYILSGDIEHRLYENKTLQNTIAKHLGVIYEERFLDYDPEPVLDAVEPRNDAKLDALRNSFVSFIHHLE